ncbi:hypothetical protein F4X88_10395 [Candidatus Poribacteria bacterium]|nr:hypothetical protein [Candidatus Poribacteria bacterium]MYA56694.1 hypothetical protein [Candidatus Poribacteria bacterium]
MDRDELILQKLSELAEDVKDLRKNVGGLQKDITDVKLQQADDRRRSETADVKLAASLERIESKLTTDLQRVESEVKIDLRRVEAKMDGVITNIGERKTDTNERWKIGGIIVSTTIAILALIKSFFFS